MPAIFHEGLWRRNGCLGEPTWLGRKSNSTFREYQTRGRTRTLNFGSPPFCFLLLFFLGGGLGQGASIWWRFSAACTWFWVAREASDAELDPSLCQVRARASAVKARHGPDVLRVSTWACLKNGGGGGGGPFWLVAKGKRKGHQPF